MISIFLLLFAALGVDCKTQPQTFFFEQYTDHFNFETKPVTFQQRYLVNDQYWTSPIVNSSTDPWEGKVRPIFFYTGNEAPIEDFYHISGFVLTLADIFNAYVVFAEHRYYGESMPFGKQSFSTQNVGHLSVENALADYARLILFLKSNITALRDSPVVVFGGSYGGSLSAYMRMSYPDIVDIALAASAPILLYDGVTDSNAFFNVVRDDFAKLDARCPDVIRAALLQVAKSSKTDVQTAMNLCQPTDATTVQLWARSAIVSLAQLDYPTSASGMPAWPATFACRAMLKIATSGNAPAIDLLRALAVTAGVYYNSSQSPLSCFDVAAEFAPCSDASGCGGPRLNDPSVTAWDYQACTEIIHNIGSDGSLFPLSPWTLSGLTKYCESVWGVAPHSHARLMHTHISDLTHIIFSNGKLDPWHIGGVLPGRVKLHRDSVALLFDNAAHHLDLRSPSINDPKSIINGRLEEQNHIAKWLREIYK